jgi:hypothetical protein
MPFDTSIYNRLQQVDQSGSLERGMRLGDLINQGIQQNRMRQQEQQANQAYLSNLQKDQQGNMSLNKQGFLRNLMETGQGQLAGGYAQQWSKEDAARQQQAFENQLKQQELANRVADRQAMRDEQRMLSGIKIKELQEKATEGQKKLDTEFAKDYNEWTSGGSQAANAEIKKLQGVASRLKSGEVTTGGLTGMFGDRLTSNNLLSARSDIQSSIVTSLKNILGGSFTEKEGDRIIKNTWNEADTTENNLNRLNRLIGDLRAQSEAKNMKAKYFQESGTLSSFSPSIDNYSENKAQQQMPTNVFKTTDIDWAD